MDPTNSTTLYDWLFHGAVLDDPNVMSEFLAGITSADLNWNNF
jgi:hypothetical protein